MTVGQMQYGAWNNEGSDNTVLYCNSLSYSALNAMGNNRGLEADQSADFVWPTNLLPTALLGIATGDGGIGVYGWANRGPFARAIVGASRFGYAGYFDGKVEVLGQLIKAGGGFRIDHPGDPENQYLSHAFVESPDMLNVYNGTVTTDSDGSATVTLPGYLAALNRDGRYQLTVIGRFAQAIVGKEIEANVFTIKTDAPNVKVSWQVTGVRQDPWAEQNRIVVEEDKPENERGTYRHAEAYGQPTERATSHAVWQALEERERELEDLRARGEAEDSGSAS
jgi:hypothetical protein